MMDVSTGHDTLERLRGLWKRRRRPALSLFALIAAAGTGLVLGLPDVYQARATILVDRSNMPASAGAPTTPEEIEAKIGALGEETMSRARLIALVHRFNLYPALRRGSDDDVVTQMRRDITLGLDQRPTAGNVSTVSLSLSYRGTSPATVALVTNELASFFVGNEDDTGLRRSSDAADLLRTQMEDVRKRMEAQEQKISDYKARHGTDLPEQLGANLATLERLNGQLERNREWQARLVERREAAARYARAADTGSVAPATGDTMILQLREELIRARMKYSDSHPDVIRIREQLAALEKAAVATPPPAATTGASGRGNPPGANGATAAPPREDAELRQLRDEEQDLRRKIASYQSRVDTAPAREGELRELTRDYEATKALYASLFQRDAETRLAGRLEQQRSGERFRILDAAVAPSKPMGPDRLRLTLIVLGLALGTALAAALVLERLDTTFHSTEQLRGARVPIVSGIPRIRLTSGRIRRRLVGTLATAAALAALGLLFVLSYQAAIGNEGLSVLALRLGS